MTLWGWDWTGFSQPPTQQPSGKVDSPHSPKRRVDTPALGNIHLLKEFESLLGAIGSWHLLRRYANRQKCTCRRDKQDDTPMRGCKFCEGEGWLFVEFPVFCYTTARPIYSNLTDTKIPAMFAELSELGRLFFVPVWAEPRNSDVIFDVRHTKDQFIQLPLERLSRFEISQAVDMRGDRAGDIEYFMCFATEQELLAR